MLSHVRPCARVSDTIELLGYSKTETSVRMNTYDMVKQEFIKKWITTLHMLDSSVEHSMNVTERKNAIRLSSDIAIAATRSGATIWSRALISRTGKHTTTCKPVAHRILKKARNRIKNRCTTITRNGQFGAKMRVRKRTELLKSLVPGGELIDGKDCLIRETLDYIVYLQAQVDVMRTVAAVDSVTMDLSKNK
ncbi:hypothetical protein Rs2_40286 [Raphanus sativus]|nr:hypothetical protein Rs2_40286 [Raphanus sativus]